MTTTLHEIPGGLMPVEGIIPGAEYVYVRGLPLSAHGHRYRVHRLVLHVPTYQRHVLCEALTGPDRGLWFTCAVGNFCMRYRPAEEPEPVKELAAEAAPAEKVAGGPTGGSGW